MTKPDESKVWAAINGYGDLSEPVELYRVELNIATNNGNPTKWDFSVLLGDAATVRSGFYLGLVCSECHFPWGKDGCTNLACHG